MYAHGQCRGATHQPKVRSERARRLRPLEHHRTHAASQSHGGTTPTAKTRTHRTAPWSHRAPQHSRCAAGTARLVSGSRTRSYHGTTTPAQHPRSSCIYTGTPSHRVRRRRTRATEKARKSRDGNRNKQREEDNQERREAKERHSRLLARCIRHKQHNKKTQGRGTANIREREDNTRGVVFPLSPPRTGGYASQQQRALLCLAETLADSYEIDPNTKQGGESIVSVRKSH